MHKFLPKWSIGSHKLLHRVERLYNFKRNVRLLDQTNVVAVIENIYNNKILDKQVKKLLNRTN